MLHSCNIPFIILYRIRKLREKEYHMPKEISKQEKEDYLSLMYEMKRKENQIVKHSILTNFVMKNYIIII